MLEKIKNRYEDLKSITNNIQEEIVVRKVEVVETTETEKGYNGKSNEKGK